MFHVLANDNDSIDSRSGFYLSRSRLLWRGAGVILLLELKGKRVAPLPEHGPRHKAEPVRPAEPAGHPRQQPGFQGQQQYPGQCLPRAARLPGQQYPGQQAHRVAGASTARSRSRPASHRPQPWSELFAAGAALAEPAGGRRANSPEPYSPQA